MKVSARSAVAPFQVMSILDRVAQLRGEGRDVISLCAGEPSGGAPQQVRELAASTHASGAALGYTSALGLRELREAIAGHYRRWYGRTVASDQVAVTTGSSGAFLLTFLAAFDAGDVVVVARPGYRSEERRVGEEGGPRVGRGRELGEESDRGLRMRVGGDEE